MPLPVIGPNPVLFQLLGFVTQAGRGVVNTTMEKLADQNPNAPVGTTLALIEQGMKVFSGIHARMHGSMEQMLRILHRLNAHHLSTEDVADETGEVTVRRADFAGPMDVCPVSDPNIFSETQRLAQIQAVLQRAQVNPQAYNMREVESEFLDRIRMGDMKERLLAQMPQPMHLNAVNENAAAMMGRPIIAFPHQDHQAHIIAHMEFLKSPVLGMNPFMSQKAAPTILNHLREHWAMLYVQKVYEATSDLPALKAQGITPESLIDIDDEDITKSYDQLMASVSSQVLQEMEKLLGQFMPDMQKVAQFAAQFQPQQQDPMAVAAMQAQADQQRGQAAMVSAQARQQDSAIKAQTAQQKLQAEQASDQQEHALRQQALQQQEASDQAQNENRMSIALLNADSRERMNESDNQTAKELAAAEILSGERVAVSTGTGINP
jgi:hypothetical protein